MTRKTNREKLKTYEVTTIHGRKYCITGKNAVDACDNFFSRKGLQKEEKDEDAILIYKTKEKK